MGKHPISVKAHRVWCTLAPSESTSCALQLPPTRSVARMVLLGPTREGNQCDCIEAIVMPSGSFLALLPPPVSEVSAGGAHSMHQKFTSPLFMVSDAAVAAAAVGAGAAVAAPFLFFFKWQLHGRRSLAAATRPVVPPLVLCLPKL